MNEINHKLLKAKYIEDRIEDNPKIFKPVAEHTARLYFAVQQLPALDAIYHFRMKWFRDLFNQSFEQKDEEGKEGKMADGSFAEDDSTPKNKRKSKFPVPAKREETIAKTKEMKMQRVVQLKTESREILFKNVFMSLFEYQKLVLKCGI